MNRLRYLVPPLLALMIASGCGPTTQAPSAVTTAPAAPVAATLSATNAAVPGAPTVETSIATEAPPTEPAAATAAPTETVGAVRPTPVQGLQRFKIEQRAKSSRLDKVELALLSAELSDQALALRVAFQNTSDSAFRLIGGLSGGDAVLVDAAGVEYKPTAVGETLKQRIEPEGGWAPGSANAGTLSFPRPAGAAPYELRFPSFEAIAFELDTPLAAAPELQPGDYKIGQNVSSDQSALARIELRVCSVKVTADRMIFDVAFANTGRQGYKLIRGPDAKEALLLDAENMAARPVEVSDAFKTSIAPEEGWQPGQEYSGTLSFRRPTVGPEVRFIFPTYDAVTIRFGGDGKAEARLTSAQGGPPRPTPTPEAGEVAFTQIQSLLAAQAEAIRTQQLDAYVQTLDPGIRDEQRRVAARIKDVPLISYTLQLAPDARLNQPESGALENVPVEVGYTLRGISPDNNFTHQMRYSFTRSGNSWQVKAITAEQNPPFWQTGDLIVRETQHFLIFARPEASAELPTLDKETQAAYDALTARGFTLEPRYVAFFAATKNDFAALTGGSSNRYLGFALARYGFVGDTITANSRAFYLNGEMFKSNSKEMAPDARQSTITHELVHLALARDTRPYTPPWLAEGAAVYFSGEATPEMRKQLVASNQLDNLKLRQLTTAGSLGEHDVLGTRVGPEYVYSGETVAYLQKKFGEAKLLEFYRSFAAVKAAEVRKQMPAFGGSFAANAVFAQLREKLTDQGVQQFFGLTLDQLDEQVKAGLRAGKGG